MKRGFWRHSPRAWSDNSKNQSSREACGQVCVQNISSVAPTQSVRLQSPPFSWIDSCLTWRLTSFHGPVGPCFLFLGFSLIQSLILGLRYRILPFFFQIFLNLLPSFLQEQPCSFTSVLTDQIHEVYSGILSEEK